MTQGRDETSDHWRRNLAVSAFGAFTTIVGMTLLLPFLPLYVEDVGISGQAAIAQWSGIAYGATFFAAALVAPLWGRLGDRYGRKLMLVRASLGMAIAIGLMGMAQSIGQLVFLRLLTGLAGGYASGAAILAATQTPKDKTGWALGIISSAVMAGNFVGPLIGGILPAYIGIRGCFMSVGVLIFLTFIATTLFIQEDKTVFSDRRKTKTANTVWQSIPNKLPVVTMLLTGTFLTFANMSIEPIITLYVQTLGKTGDHVTFWAGVIMSVTALGSALSASWLGRLADRVGHWQVLIGAMVCCALLLLPQAFVTSAWQLASLRFLMGVSLGGLIPCVTAVLRHSVPAQALGTILGVSVSAQYIGQVAGPVSGGFIGGHFGMPAVFLMTAAIMLTAALLNMKLKP